MMSFSTVYSIKPSPLHYSFVYCFIPFLSNSVYRTGDKFIIDDSLIFLVMNKPTMSHNYACISKMIRMVSIKFGNMATLNLIEQTTLYGSAKSFESFGRNYSPNFACMNSNYTNISAYIRLFSTLRTFIFESDSSYS